MKKQVLKNIKECLLKARDKAKVFCISRMVMSIQASSRKAKCNILIYLGMEREKYIMPTNR